MNPNQVSDQGVNRETAPAPVARMSGITPKVIAAVDIWTDRSLMLLTSCGPLA